MIQQQLKDLSEDKFELLIKKFSRKYGRDYSLVKEELTKLRDSCCLYETLLKAAALVLNNQEPYDNWYAFYAKYKNRIFNKDGITMPSTLPILPILGFEPTTIIYSTKYPNGFYVKRWQYKLQHWILMNGAKEIYNSLRDSQTRKFGSSNGYIQLIKKEAS